jgi:hypothetical protein
MKRVKREIVEVKQFIEYERRVVSAERLAGQQSIILNGFKFNICITCAGICYKCFTWGHISKNCQEHLKTVICNHCNEMGHVRARTVVPIWSHDTSHN